MDLSTILNPSDIEPRYNHSYQTFVDRTFALMKRPITKAIISSNVLNSESVVVTAHKVRYVEPPLIYSAITLQALKMGPDYSSEFLENHIVSWTNENKYWVLETIDDPLFGETKSYRNTTKVKAKKSIENFVKRYI